MPPKKNKLDYGDNLQVLREYIPDASVDLVCLDQNVLFVYGTLHPDQAPREIQRVVRRMIPIGKGTVRGEVHNLGEYPALVVDTPRQRRVPGTIFALPDDAGMLSALDHYEDFRPEDPKNSLFIRSKRTVTLAGGKRKRCWVYIYNRPLPSEAQCL